MKRDAKVDLAVREADLEWIKTLDSQREALKIICESQSRWAKRAQEAEELLKEILPAAKYLSQRYDNGTDKELNFWTAMVAKITKFLGVEPCDK